MGIESVREINLLKHFMFGFEMKPLMWITPDQPPMTIWVTLREPARWMSEFLAEILGLPMPETRKAALALFEHIQTVSGLMQDAVENHTGVPITVEASYHFRTLLSAFILEFEREERHLNIFGLYDIGTHSTTKLLEHAHRNLPSDVRSRLTPEVIADFDEAGRCLAFDRPTATGFHVLRAVEPLILAYHNKVTRNILPLRSRSWGAYIGSLKRPGHVARVDVRVVGMLEHIKDFYRNPIMHPEESLTSDQAFSLFNACLSVIVQLDAATQACPP